MPPMNPNVEVDMKHWKTLSSFQQFSISECFPPSPPRPELTMWRQVNFWGLFFIYFFIILQLRLRWADVKTFDDLSDRRLERDARKSFNQEKKKKKAKDQHSAHANGAEKVGWKASAALAASYSRARSIDPPTKWPAASGAHRLTPSSSFYAGPPREDNKNAHRPQFDLKE